MVFDPRDPKIIKQEAAGKIAALLEAHGIPAFYGRKVMVMNIIAMFEADWDDLRQAAHQLHAAIKVGRTHADPANCSPREINEPEYSGGIGGPVSHNDPVLVTEKRLREVMDGIRGWMSGTDHEGENVKRRLTELGQKADGAHTRYRALTEEVEQGRRGLIYRLDALEKGSCSDREALWPRIGALVARMDAQEARATELSDRLAKLDAEMADAIAKLRRAR